MRNPIFHPDEKTHQSGDYSHAELSLANRNCGTLLETLRHDVTPIGAHYLLSHFDVPYVRDASDWSLTTQGCVENQLTLSIDQLKQLARDTGTEKTLRVTLECAGNGRANLSPRWPSQPWQLEAVGTTDWHGIPLHQVLELTGLNSNSRELVFHGADHGIDGGKVHHFARSLSLRDALHEDVLLVWQMNDQPLLPQHGFPLRLIVPGWYGMASVKWLNSIEVIDHAFEGHQQTGTYIYRQNDNDPGTPVTHIRVKSLMVPPGIPDWSTRRRLVKPGTIKLSGRAWSGCGRKISKVEWSCDGQWYPATLQTSSNPYSWCGWEAQWQASAGQHSLSCRATDEAGNTQPIDPPWDKAGFGNNAVQNVEVWCEDY